MHVDVGAAPGAAKRVATTLALLCAFAVGTAPAAGSERTPEETVRRYLQAMKDAKPEDAFDLVSRAMRGGKDREAWVREAREGLSWADVKIFSFEVGAAKVEGDKAFVPNVLSSQDKFVNQLGLTEYELYTLVKEDGVWRVDQQVIVEPADLSKWFPKVQKGAAPGAAPVGEPPAAPPPSAPRPASPATSPPASH